jgi:hypothetical protein
MIKLEVQLIACGRSPEDNMAKTEVSGTRPVKTTYTN